MRPELVENGRHVEQSDVPGRFLDGAFQQAQREIVLSKSDMYRRLLKRRNRDVAFDLLESCKRLPRLAVLSHATFDVATDAKCIRVH